MTRREEGRRGEGRLRASSPRWRERRGEVAGRTPDEGKGGGGELFTCKEMPPGKGGEVVRSGAESRHVVKVRRVGFGQNRETSARVVAYRARVGVWLTVSFSVGVTVGIRVWVWVRAGARARVGVGVGVGTKS